MFVCKGDNRVALLKPNGELEGCMNVDQENVEYKCRYCTLSGICPEYVERRKRK